MCILFIGKQKTTYKDYYDKQLGRYMIVREKATSHAAQTLTEAGSFCVAC